jgi:WD40 repeat protein
MHKVATEVVELPRRYHDVASIGTAFSPSGEELEVEAEPGVIEIWDWRHKRLITSLKKPRGAEGVVTDPLSYSPDGRLLAACDTRGVGNVVVRVWNTQDWQIANDITESAPRGCDAMAFMVDGRQLVRANNAVVKASKLAASDISTWQEVWTLELERMGPESLAISPVGSRLADGGKVVTVDARYFAISDAGHTTIWQLQ